MEVIGCNTRRFKKQLDTPNEEGMPVTCKEFDNPREEYMCVVAALKKRMERALTNATGFMATLCSEKMMAKSVGELVAAFADATVPKVNVIIGKAYGTAYVAMNSKSIGADLVYAWDNAEIGMMDASLAAKIMYADADAAELNEKAAQYRELQNGVASAAARGYVDTVISPADTRKYVIGAFEMLFTKREDRPSKKHGTV